MSKVCREPARGCCTYAARVGRTISDSKTPNSPVISFLLFKNERLLNKPLTASLMGQTDKNPAHVLQKATTAMTTPPGFTSVDTPGVPLLPSQLFLSAVLSLRSIHPPLRPAAYRSRSACRPVSSACRCTVRGPRVLGAPHIFSSSSGEKREEGGNTGPALSPLPGSMCFNAFFFFIIL